MAEYPDYDKKNALLAALGYVPLLLLNIIIPIYILIKKESRYARLHAAQSLFIFIIFFFLTGVLAVIAFSVLGYTYSTSGLFEAVLGNISPTEVDFSGIYTGMGILGVVAGIFLMIYIIVIVVMIYAAATGKKIWLPIITKLLLGKKM